MYGLDGVFRDLKEVARDGFGPVLEATRGGRRWTIRVLHGTEIAPERASLLRSPPHPAVVRAEAGAIDGGVYVAAEMHGRPLALSARESGAGALLLPPSCAEAMQTLVEAVVAFSASGEAIGPLTWNNVHLDPARPQKVEIFPLWMARTRSTDWLRHDARDLLFVDRDALREEPGAHSVLFGLGALLLVLSRGASALPVVSGDAEELIRRAVLEGHPLAAMADPGGPFAGAVRSALARLEDPRALLDALRSALHSLEALAEAGRRSGEGDRLAAIAALHRAVNRAREEGLPTWHLCVVKSKIERAHGLDRRALASIAEAVAAEPRSSEALRQLGGLAQAPDEAERALRSAVALDPLDPTLRLRLARARARIEDIEGTLRERHLVQSLLIADPRAAMEVDVARGLFDLGDRRAAFEIAERLSSASADREVRVEATALAGQVLYAERAYRRAALRLVSSARRSLRLGRRPALERVNEAAFALAACRKPRAVRLLAELSLRLDPNQPLIARLHATVVPGGTS